MMILLLIANFNFIFIVHRVILKIGILFAIHEHCHRSLRPVAGFKDAIFVIEVPYSGLLEPGDIGLFEDGSVVGELTTLTTWL